MAESNFAPRRLYWIAVRLVGGLVRRVKSTARGRRGSATPVRDLLASDTVGSL
jgi:hypothetical protein